MRNDYTHQTPAAVTGSVACGVAPLPLLAVYTVIFLIHGSIKPVHPPDVTSTTHGELIAGFVSLVLLIALVFCLLWFLNGKRRWPLAVMELAALVVFFDFMIDSTKGGPVIPALLVLTSLVSLVLMFAPASWWWLDRAAPKWIVTVTRVVLRRPAAPAASAATEQTVVFPADEIVLDEPVAEKPAAV